MKVKDTLNIDLLYATLLDKLMNFVGGDKRKTGSWSAWESIQLVKKTFPSWQYNGVATFEDVMLWCEEHLHNDWIWNFETIYFKTQEDKLVFMLRWR